VVLAVAVVLSGVGAAIWSRTVASGDDPETIVLGTDNMVDPASTNPPQVGERLAAVDLVDRDGTAITLEPDGRPMVVNLWYSTCGPCARELQHFAALDAELGGRVRFVGVDPLDSVDDMAEFADTRGVRYELLRDTRGALVDALGISWYPATLFVTADGLIIAQTGEISEDELRAHINHLLA
jgi:peroxiredoxin